MKILLWIWCFPQMLLGVVVKIITKARKRGDHYEFDVKFGSISLGEYVFLCPSHWNDETALKHEQGHTKQSRYLGWLYLLLIGLPSIIWCGCCKKYRKVNGVNYYDFYTEKWADKIMGIKR